MNYAPANTVYDLDLGVSVARDATQYHLHHVICAPAKFEIATSNIGVKATHGSGGDTFTRKYIT